MSDINHKDCMKRVVKGGGGGGGGGGGLDPVSRKIKRSFHNSRKIK